VGKRRTLRCVGHDTTGSPRMTDVALMKATQSARELRASKISLRDIRPFL
jgi:hypothetical protein